MDRLEEGRGDRAPVPERGRESKGGLVMSLLLIDFLMPFTSGALPSAILFKSLKKSYDEASTADEVS